MEFKCLTNIETSFRQLRMYALVFAGICAVVTVAAVWMSYSFAERQRHTEAAFRFSYHSGTIVDDVDNQQLVLQR